MFDDMSTYDIHLWQNWAKWDIALVLKNLTEHWLSCLVGLGWFLFFFNFFFLRFCLSKLGWHLSDIQNFGLKQLNEGFLSWLNIQHLKFIFYYLGDFQLSLILH